MGSEDAVAGFRAISELLATPGQALPLLARVPRVEPVTQAEFDRLLGDLDDDDFQVRRRAAQALLEKGSAVEARLRGVLAGAPGAEVRRAVGAILRRLGPSRPERLRSFRAAEVLEGIGSAEARSVLERLAGGAAGVEETEGARDALRRLRLRAGEGE